MIQGLVISFCSKNYIWELEIWLAKIASCGVNASRIMIYCFDEESIVYCRGKNISCELLPAVTSKSDIWEQRCKVFFNLASVGQDFIHSDLDALWSKDLSKYIETCDQDFELMFSCGTCNPRKTWQKLGFVLCMGVFYSRGNPKTELFWKNIAQYVGEIGDDQTALNRLITNNLESWNQPTEIDKFESFTIPCSNVNIPSCSFPRKLEKITCTIENQLFKLGIIPHNICSRVTYFQKGTYINHPLLPPKKGIRLEQYQKMNLL